MPAVRQLLVSGLRSQSLTLYLLSFAGILVGFAFTLIYLEYARPKGTKITELIPFTSAAGRPMFPRTGWHYAETWGTWSDGSRAEFQWPLRSTPSGDVIVAIEGRIFPYDAAIPQTIRVMVNGHRVAVIKRNLEGGLYGSSFAVPLGVATARNPMHFVFEVSNPTSPSAISTSADQRKLGIGIETIELNYNAY